MTKSEISKRVYSGAKIPGGCGGCDTSNLKNSRFRRAIEDFAGQDIMKNFSQRRNATAEVCKKPV